MEYEKSLTVAADPARVWKVLSDIERWPERITTYQEVRRLDDGDLRVGSRAHVKQKGLAAGEWEVSELVEDTTFTWASRQPGVRIVGRHTVSTDADGRTSRLTLVLEQSGWLSGVVTMVAGPQGPGVRRPRGRGVEGRGRGRVTQRPDRSRRAARARDRPLRRPRHRRHQPARAGRGDRHQPPDADLPLRLARGTARGRGRRGRGGRPRRPWRGWSRRRGPTPTRSTPGCASGASSPTTRWSTARCSSSCRATRCSASPTPSSSRSSLVTTWLDALTSMWRARGVPARRARDPGAARPRRRARVAARPAAHRRPAGGRRGDAAVRAGDGRGCSGERGSARPRRVRQLSRRKPMPRTVTTRSTQADLLQLLPEPADGDVEGLGRAVPALAPHVGHQLRARDHLVAVGGEHGEHVELLAGQRHLVVADVDPVGLDVDEQAAPRGRRGRPTGRWYDGAGRAGGPGARRGRTAWRGSRRRPSRGRPPGRARRTVP